VRAFLIAVAACLLLAAPATAQAKKTPPKRKGGEVRRIHNLPKRPLARFLAQSSLSNTSSGVLPVTGSCA